MSDPLTDRALSRLDGAGIDQAPPQPSQQPSGDPLTDRALSMLDASPEDLRKATAPKPEEGVSIARMAAGSPTAIAGLAGMPVDVATGAANDLANFRNRANEVIANSKMGAKLTEMGAQPSPGTKIENPVGGSEWLNNLLGKIGLGTAALPARNAPERIGQQVTGGVTNAVLPFAAARAGLIPEAFGAGPPSLPGGAAQQAAIGAGAGLGGGIATEAAPDNLKPTANALGQIVGGGLTAGGMGLSQGAYRYGAKKIEDFRMPSQMAKAGEEALSSGLIPKAAPGSPEDVATFFTDRLNAADDAATQHILQTTQEAKSKVDVLGAPKSAQDIGHSMQTLLGEAADREHQAASKLYEAVDPDKTLNVSGVPLKEQVGAVQKDIPQLAKPPSGEEAAIYNDVSNVGDSLPFSEVQALRSRVSNAIHQEVMASGGESPELRRLSQIKAAINDSLAQAAVKAAEADPAVATRLQATGGAYSATEVPFGAEIARAYRSSPATLRAATRSGDPFVSSVLGLGDTGNDIAASAPLSQVRGSVGQGGGGPRNVASGPQVPAGQQSLSEALDRLAAANQKYAEYKNTFRKGPVGGVLKPGPAPGTFATPESAVPSKLTGTPEQIAAFEKAAGSPQKAEELLHDHLASTIPRTAEGTIDIGRYPAWLDKISKAGVFDAFPNLEARFTTAADAAKTMADANALRLMTQRAHQKSAASLFTQGNDPVNAVARALSGAKAEANLRELWTAVKGKPDAEMGLKRAIVEHLRHKAGEKGIVGNDATLKFLRDHRAALRPVFGDAHLDQIEKIASAFHKPRGAHHIGSISDLVTLYFGEHLGHAVEGSLGAVSHGAGFVLLGAKKLGQTMRANGIKHVDELMDEVMLNPRLARTMADKLTRSNQESLLARFGNQLAAVTAESPGNQRDTTDAVIRTVSAMAPGEAITIQRLKALSGKSDITDLRQQMISRGLIKEQNGRYIRAEAINSGDTLAKQPKGVVGNPTILDRVHKAIQQRAPTLRRQSLHDLNNEIESRPSPYHGSYRPGGLAEHTAAVSQGTPLTHDVVHLLRRSGAIPRDEWSVLSNKADDWAKKLGVEGPRGVRQEEAVAQAYNHWKAGDMPLPPGLRRIMGGITAVAERASA